MQYLTVVEQQDGSPRRFEDSCGAISGFTRNVVELAAYLMIRMDGAQDSHSPYKQQYSTCTKMVEEEVQGIIKSTMPSQTFEDHEEPVLAVAVFPNIVTVTPSFSHQTLPS